MAHSAKLTILFLFAAVLFLTETDDVEAQTSRYELLTSPDLWYNDVDGIRAGARIKGQVPGTFEDGPHRLDAGIWLGTWLPDLPVSYYLRYTEPISAWSDYGSEASVELVSLIRTGYHRHGAGFNKRWQQGFDERRYREFRTRTTFEQRFDDEYVQFPVLWSDQAKVLTRVTGELRNDNRLGWYNLSLNGTLQYLDDGFGTAELEAIQRVPFGETWGLRFRLFSGMATSNTLPEYLFPRSSSPAIDWISNGVTRAKGTIPQPWMRSGNMNVSGGANLRGYTSADIATFRGDDPLPFLFNSVAAFNAELDYPNPIGVLFKQIPYASEFLTFRSYLFSDTGRSLGLSDGKPDTVFSNAGAGFALSLNIPDYLGKPRGFVLRWEVPFWLSEPGDEDSFAFRSLFGFGAVITF